VSARTLALEVDPAQLARRPAPSAYARAASGWLGIYRREVQPMATGAVLGGIESSGGP